MSKIDSIDPAKAGEMKKDFAVLQKEVDLLKVQIRELRQANQNPLAR
jgi:hypothetical protein